MKLFSTQPYKGTRDFFPEFKKRHNWMFDRLKRVLGGFAYKEYDGPMLEPFELYAAKSGEELVSQQLYWMMDRGERKMAIRPEMTPTLARMVASRLQEEPKPIRWFSTPNLWRYERPQRGRLREHWQLNVDVVGGDSTLADAELIQIAVDIFKAFKGEEFLQIKINNRRLIDTLFKGKMSLDEATALKLSKIVDAKAKLKPEIYAEKLAEIGIEAENAKVMEDFFSSDFDGIKEMFPNEDSVEELSKLFSTLDALGVPKNCFCFDPTIMRGLDYYTGTVFEAFDVSPENNRALFGGGRYDNLLGLFSKNAISGAGFGLGDVTLMNFLETHNLLEELPNDYDVAFVCVGEKAWGAMQAKVGALREKGLRVFVPLDWSSSMKSQLKTVDKNKAPYVVIIGEDELDSGAWTFKNMAEHSQEIIPSTELVEKLLAKII